MEVFVWIRWGFCGITVPVLLIPQPSPHETVSGNLRFARYLFNKITEATDDFLNRSPFLPFFFFLFSFFHLQNSFW